MRALLLLLLLLAACTSSPPRPSEPLSGRSEVAGLPPRMEYDADSLPESLVVVGQQLVWVDSVGSLYTIPIDKSRPARALYKSDAHGTKRALISIGRDEVIAGGIPDLVRARLPAGSTQRFHIQRLDEITGDLVADDRFVYFTVFQADDIWRVPLAGGRPTKFHAGSQRPSLALHAGTLYAAGLDGTLVALPTAGGPPTQLATNTGQRGALVVDDTHLFIANDHPEGGLEPRPETIDRIELATRARTTIATFRSIDDLHLEGDWLYAVVTTGKTENTTVGQVVRMARDGSRQRDLLDRIETYGTFAFDADALYATSGSTIIRLARTSF
jgi:hypothetical protein